jgi:hypothetical protein
MKRVLESANRRDDLDEVVDRGGRRPHDRSMGTRLLRFLAIGLTFVVGVAFVASLAVWLIVRDEIATLRAVRTQAMAGEPMPSIVELAVVAVEDPDFYIRGRLPRQPSPWPARLGQATLVNQLANRFTSRGVTASGRSKKSS